MCYMSIYVLPSGAKSGVFMVAVGAAAAGEPCYTLLLGATLHPSFRLLCSLAPLMCDAMLHTVAMHHDTVHDH